MTAGGLEAPIVKAAAAAVSRVAPSLLSRAAQSWRVQRAADLVDPSEVTLPKLTAAQAACVTGYVASRDFHVVAVQVALSAVEELSGRAVTVPSGTITRLLTEGLRVRGEWVSGTLRQVADFLKQALSREVTVTLRPLRAADYSATELARYIKSAGDQAAAALRNSALLHSLANLEAIHRFEGDLRDQIRALSQNMRVPNAGPLRFVSFDALYVEPVLQFGQASMPASDRLMADRYADLRSGMTVPGSRLLNASDRVVVLGDPGGGKSTLAARTVRDLANDPAGPVPLLLVLRDFVEEFRVGRSTIAEHLASLCRSPYQVEPPVDALEYLLLNRRAVVIFDGLDELFEPAVRTKVAEAIHGFAHRYPNTPVLVTSRKVGYYESPLSEALFQVAELEAFSEAQVAEYARKWFALDRASLADKFMGESELVADLRTNPLMLSLMCGLYRDEGYIPSNRPDVYEKCALLLFERWDKQRGLNVSQRFDAHVRQAIQSLAWWLYTDREHQTSLTRARLQEFMTEFLHRERFADRADAEDAAASFIDFCTGRAWVLSKTGLRGNQELFDFTHRTFLEYFAATHMVRRDPHAARLFEQLQPHLRRAGWEVVGQLALQTLNRSVENGANDFLDALITAAGESDLPERSNLLAFAGRSLAFVVPNPAVVRRVVAEIVTFFLEMPDIDGKPGARYVPGFGRLFIYDQAFMALQAVTGELMGDIKNAVVESIASALCREPVPDNVLLACEDPRFFLIDTVDDPNRQGSFAELSASYQARLQDHPFAWHDVRRVLDGNLPVKKLVKRHGVQALYPDVYMSVTAAEGRAHFGIASQLRMRTITNADTFAAEIVPVLTSCAKPWVQDNAIFDNHDFARGHDELGLVNRGSYFAAVLLLTLPLVEYKIINAGEVRLPASDPVLGDIPVLCEGARLGRIPALSLKAALAPKAMPAAAADFVARWANHEFSLLDPALTPR